MNDTDWIKQEQWNTILRVQQTHQIIVSPTEDKPTVYIKDIKSNGVWTASTPEEAIQIINNTHQEKQPWYDWFLRLHKTWHNRYIILTRQPNLKFKEDTLVEIIGFSEQTKSYDDVESLLFNYPDMAIYRNPIGNKEITFIDWINETDKRIEDTWQFAYPCHQCNSGFKACGSDHVCPNCMTRHHQQWEIESKEYASFNFQF